MTLDKFGRHLSHPFHLVKKLKTAQNVAEQEDALHILETKYKIDEVLQGIVAAIKTDLTIQIKENKTQMEILRKEFKDAITLVRVDLNAAVHEIKNENTLSKVFLENKLTEKINGFEKKLKDLKNKVK